MEWSNVHTASFCLAYGAAYWNQNYRNHIGNYALKDVIDCWNIVPHRKTMKIPLKIKFWKTSPEADHSSHFGYRVEFRQQVKKLEAFEPRTENGIILYHESSGVYRVETGTGTYLAHKILRERISGKISNINRTESTTEATDSESSVKIFVEYDNVSSSNDDQSLDWIPEKDSDSGSDSSQFEVNNSDSNTQDGNDQGQNPSELKIDKYVQADEDICLSSNHSE